jgi:thioredoxin
MEAADRVGAPAAEPEEREPMSASPLHVTDASFQKDVLESPTPVLVDFWAPWCGPCKMIAPVLDELAGEFAGRVAIAKVNVDDHQQHAAQFRVQGIPTMILFKDGREVDRLVGAAPKAQLARWIQGATQTA